MTDRDALLAEASALLEATRDRIEAMAQEALAAGPDEPERRSRHGAALQEADRLAQRVDALARVLRALAEGAAPEAALARAPIEEIRAPLARAIGRDAPASGEAGEVELF